MYGNLGVNNRDTKICPLSSSAHYRGVSVKRGSTVMEYFSLNLAQLAMYVQCLRIFS